jgi:hypothetical protein
MTGLGKFQPGGELACAECQMQATGKDGDPACVIALEIAQFGESMSATCCPETIRVAA